MAQDQITFFSNIAGASIFFALTLTFIYLWHIRAVHGALALAAVASMFWQLAIAADGLWIELERPALLVLEIARDGAWINALLSCLKFVSGQALPGRFSRIIHGVWLAALVATGSLYLLHSPLVFETGTLVWSGLLLAIVGLVSVEQLYRNTQQYRLIKLLSIAIGSMFIYDIYLFSNSLIFNQIDPDLWQARGSINSIAGLFMALGALAIANQTGQQARLAISRPVVFYSTSLTVAGSFLALMAIGGYYVQLYGGSWGTIIQILVLFVALMMVALVFVSRTARSQLNVWINKHFFHHKYDYRVEWLKLINDLSRSSADENFHEQAIKSVAAVFQCPGGALWLRKGRYFVPVHAYHVELPDAGLEEPIDTPFCQAMKNEEWVFSPHSPENERLSAFNELLPQWVYRIDQLWLVLPLLTEAELVGFMMLPQPRLDTSLTWEDLDMAKAVGRQVASYLDRHEAAELLAESRQFDAFNKLTAFIMHDLKNLIAQQALVVKNASKHRDNPAFFEDAIHTIDNSVARMNNLLKKLQQNEPSEMRSLELHRVLMEAVKRCKEQRPVPSLRLEDTDMTVNADQDRLVMTLTHVIKNAQEASRQNGFVDVTLRKQDNDAIITVEDNGVGMDQDFIRNQLFRPFVTTKSGKGMGIGVYQTREFISSLGGGVSVESTIDEGTTFTITLPLSS